MEIYQLRLTTVAEYVTAFRTIEPEITDNQRAMLLVHPPLQLARCPPPASPRQSASRISTA